MQNITQHQQINPNIASTTYPHQHLAVMHCACAHAEKIVRRILKHVKLSKFHSALAVVCSPANQSSYEEVDLKHVVSGDSSRV